MIEERQHSVHRLHTEIVLVCTAELSADPCRTRLHQLTIHRAERPIHEAVRGSLQLVFVLQLELKVLGFGPDATDSQQSVNRYLRWMQQGDGFVD